MLNTVRLNRDLTLADGEYLADYMPLLKGDVLFVNQMKTSDEDKIWVSIVNGEEPFFLIPADCCLFCVPEDEI